MRKLIFIALLIAFIHSSAYSFNEEFLQSNTTLDGNVWVSLTKQQKGAFMMGIVQGIAYCSATLPLDEIGLSPESIEGLTQFVYSNLIPETSFDDTVGYIDGFYSDELNRKIPFINVYTLMLADTKGFVGDRKDKYIQELRDNFAQ